jgi:hypothetical protein
VRNATLKEPTLSPLITLTPEQAATLLAFLEAFEAVTTGVWAKIEEEMVQSHGIEDPDAALTEAREALSA